MSDRRPFSDLRPTVMRDFYPAGGQKLEVKVPFPGGSLKIGGKPFKEASATLSVDLERGAPPKPAHRPPHRHVPRHDGLRRTGPPHPAYRPPPGLNPPLPQPRTPSPGFRPGAPNGIVGTPTASAQHLRRPTHWARPTVYPVKHPRTMHDHALNVQTLLLSATAALARANPHLTSGFRLGAPAPPPPKIIHRR
jgi:hypothetical protein